MNMPIQVRFTDVDIYGHVNNAIYAELFDTARYTYMKQLLPDADRRADKPVGAELAGLADFGRAEDSAQHLSGSD